MSSYVGSFYNYRMARYIPVGRVQLDIWELDGKIPHNMKVWRGTAGDAYGAMQSFTFQSVIVLLQSWNNTAVFQLSNDGSTYQDEIEVDINKNLGSWFHRFAGKGFRVKNKQAGAPAYYQVIAFE